MSDNEEEDCSYSKIPVKHHCQGLISYHLPAIRRAGLWAEGLQISASPSCLSLLLLFWETLQVGWANTWGLLPPALPSPALPSPGRLPQPVAGRWPNVAGLMDGLTRALQLSASHSPFSLVSPPLRCPGQLVGAQSEQLQISLSLPLWSTQGIFIRTGRSTPPELSVSCLRFSDTVVLTADNALLQHHFLADKIGKKLLSSL